MNRYEEIGDTLEGYVEELEQRAWDTPSSREAETMKAALGHIGRAASLLLGLGVTEPLRAEVVALEAMCRRCGKDLGDHAIAAPFPRYLESNGMLVCDGFVDVLATQPPEPAPATDAAELAGAGR
jgi:hypothetical protein